MNLNRFSHSSDVPARTRLRALPATGRASMAGLLACAMLACGGTEQSDPAPVVVEALNPPARSYWPTADWRTATPESTGVDSAKLEEAAKYAMTLVGEDTERKGIRTDGLVIIRNGELILERYNRGYEADTPHLVWSVTKSFVNTLYGIATKDGLVDIDAPAHKYFPALKQPDREKMTIRNILNMSSGIFWAEGYEASPLKSSVVAMLYTRGRSDMAAFTASQSMRGQPGSYVYYSSGDTNLLMGMFRKIVPEAEYADYAWNKLFDVIGMRNVTWERDGSGTFVGSSYLYATPRDLAKFGYLYLNDGVWAGERILPEGWVNFTRTPAPGYVSTPEYEGLDKDVMTAHWYTNAGYPAADIPPAWPDAPRDTFSASGHWGQFIFVIPSLDMVIVRVGDDRDGSFDRNEFLKLVAASVIAQ